MQSQERTSLGRYRSNLRSAVGASATAYGYTLTIWSTGAVLSHAYGPPSPPLVFAFIGGAVLAFALVGVLAFGSVRAEFAGPANRIQLWGGFHIASVGLAVGAGWLVSIYAPSFPGWPLGAFVATAAYLATVGAESTVADQPADQEG